MKRKPTVLRFFSSLKNIIRGNQERREKSNKQLRNLRANIVISEHTKGEATRKEEEKKLY